jgi:large subunit ribosomal protein L22
VIDMPQFRYAFQNYDKTRHVRASIREKDISHKHSREIAVAIKGMSIEKARDFLENVIARKEAVPYRRYNMEVAHRSNIRDGFFAGRFPEKAAAEFLKLLDNLESNAEYKGMDLDRLRIVSAVVHKGTKLQRFQPRAMGRSSPKYDILIHVELVAQEARGEE